MKSGRMPVIVTTCFMTMACEADSIDDGLPSTLTAEYFTFQTTTLALHVRLEAASKILDGAGQATAQTGPGRPRQYGLRFAVRTVVVADVNRLAVRWKRDEPVAASTIDFNQHLR